MAEAKRLLREALDEHQSEFTDVRGPRPEMAATYQQAIEELSKRRGGNLFFPYLGSGIGKGALVELADGSVKFDMITGIGVHAFGHSDPDLLEASIDAALGDTVMQGNLQQNMESSDLCGEFLKIAQGGGAKLAHCFLTTSGAMANENAFKLMFHKKAPATRMLAFSNCFAGRTLAMSQVTDRAKNRPGLPPTIDVDYVPFHDHRDPGGSTESALSRLREILERYPGQHAGMLMELIQGEGGYYSAPREFFLALINILREHDIPVCFDEIQTFSRTTRPFAFQHLELDDFADVVTVGKMTQVCATLFTDEFIPAPGLVSQTFTGATSSIFAARSILQRMQTGNYYGDTGRLMQIHNRFVARFERMEKELKLPITGPWGIGGMVAFTVGDGSPQAAREFLNRLFEAGVIAFSAGSDPTRIRMLPPFGAITDDQIERVCDNIETVLGED